MPRVLTAARASIAEEAAVAEADPGHEERLQLLQEQKAKSQRLDREIEHREAILEERDRGIREVRGSGQVPPCDGGSNAFPDLIRISYADRRSSSRSGR